MIAMLPNNTFSIIIFTYAIATSKEEKKTDEKGVMRLQHPSFRPPPQSTPPAFSGLSFEVANTAAGHVWLKSQKICSFFFVGFFFHLVLRVISSTVHLPFLTLTLENSDG